MSIFRLRAYFVAENRSSFQLPMTRYRAAFHSLIKKAVEAFDEVLYHQHFNTKRPIPKPYTFAVLFNRGAHFDRNTITAQSLSFLFSTNDLMWFTAVYNQLVKIKNKGYLFPNSVRLYAKQTQILPVPKVQSEKIRVQTLSPILIRDPKLKTKTTTKEEKYLLPRCKFRGSDFNGDHGFEDCFKENIRRQINAVTDETMAKELKAQVEELHFISDGHLKGSIFQIEKNGKVLKMPGFRGVFSLEGPKPLLTFLLATGIGARRSQGFGMIDLIST